WLPAKLERQVALFRRDPELAVVYTRRRLMDEEGWELEHCQVPLPRGRVLPTLFRLNVICFSSVLINRAALDEVGLFDESLALAVALLAAAGAVALPGPPGGVEGGGQRAVLAGDVAAPAPPGRPPG